MSKAGTKEERRASYLERVSIVFADPLRLKILAELHVRPMSATQFFRTFGGGSVRRVERHFKKLAEHGWLELENTERGGRRRGANEHFYRATELAVFDLETWTHLPHSVRVEFSQRTYEQLAERVRDAIEAGTFDARPERQFNWTSVSLDLKGWKRLTSELDSLFFTLVEEQTHVGARLGEDEGESMLATVAMAAFESPRHGENQGHPGGVGTGPAAAARPRGGGADASAHRLAKLFRDPLNMKIVSALNLQRMSPTQFWREFGGPSQQDLDRRFKALAEQGWLAKVEEKSGGRRRGATEHFYRATGPASFKERGWSEVSGSLKADSSWLVFEQLTEQALEAMTAGTFDARPERHLSWSLLQLDQPGWERVLALLEERFEQLSEEEKRAKARLAREGGEQLHTTVALAAFESPREQRAKAF